MEEYRKSPSKKATEALLDLFPIIYAAAIIAAAMRFTEDEED